jgi:WD40 repeat protein
MPADPNRVKDLFLAAADLPASDRPAFLAGACGGDAELLAAVERLLAAHAAPDSRIDRGAGEPPGAGATGTFAPDSPTADHPPAGTPGQLLAGRYKLVEPIGEGGMGAVWMAQQIEPVKRVVAVKLIKAGMDSKAVLARFEAERQALALMDHPNIAKVLDAGLTTDGRPYFVMELVKGVPITQFCDTRKLTPRQRLELFVPVCEAIQHAHQKGVIHRDIKPSNVLVALYDDRPVPKVIDFGVAKAAGQPLTERTLMTGFGAVVGTPEYMSPEQASFNQLDIDTRSDVYALGVLLYELLTGSPPFSPKELEKAGLLEVLRVIREVEPPRPSARLSTAQTLASLAAVRGTEPARLTRLVRGELDWLVMKALEKDRARRYETANAFAAEVQRYLAGEPVQAVPPSVGYRLRTFARRHRAGVLTAAAFGLLLLAGAAVSTWQAVVATQARNEANNERDAAGKARDAEADARAKTELALTDSREKAARMTYERAQALCEEGQADLGLLWMARSLELTPPGAVDLDRVIRTSMNLWARQIHTIRPFPVLFEPNVMPLHADMSPDGRRLIAAHPDGSARLWDVATGKLLLVLEHEDEAPPPGGSVAQAAFSPDGRFVAVARGDDKARLWEAATGRPLGRPLCHDALVKGVSFDARSKLLATAGGKAIRFWNVERGEPDGAALTTPEDARGVEFSLDGRWILAWGARQVFVWEAASRKLLHMLKNADFDIQSVAFSPDGQYFLANGWGEARFWDVEGGKPVGSRMAWRDRVGSGGWHRACFRADGKVAVTGGYPPRVWQVPSGRPLGATNSFLEAYAPILTPDGRTLVDGGMRYALDVAPGLEPAQVFSLPDNLFALVASPDNQTLAAVEWHHDRHTCRLLSLRTGRAIGDPIEMEAQPSTKPALPVYSPDGRTLAFGAGKNGFEVRDAVTGQRRGPRFTTESTVRALAFSPDGQVLASGDLGGVVRLWSTGTGQPVGKSLVHRHGVTLLRFSPDGAKLLAAGYTGSRSEAHVWQVATGEPLATVRDIFYEVHDAAFSPDGKSFATGALQLTLWDAATGQQLWVASPGAVGTTLQVVFSPDGRRLLARLMEDDAVRLFDARTGRPAGAPLRHQNRVAEVSFSPDGRLVLTASRDRTARLWDTLIGLPVGPVWKNSVMEPRGTFTADGKSVLLCEDGVIARWQIPSPIEGTPEQVRLAVEVATRHFLDEHGGLSFLFPVVSPESIRQGRLILTPDPYEPVRKRLEELGGPPGYFRR